MSAFSFVTLSGATTIGLGDFGCFTFFFFFFIFIFFLRMKPQMILSFFFLIFFFFTPFVGGIELGLYGRAVILSGYKGGKEILSEQDKREG